MEQRNLTLPSHAQKLENCSTRPDFLYEKDCVAIYVDGPHHQFPTRGERDAIQTECMEDIGFSVVRFGVKDDWEEIVKASTYFWSEVMTFAVGSLVKARGREWVVLPF